MTELLPSKSRASAAPVGLLYLSITAIGWGSNWPVSKYLLGLLPPFTLRGGVGVIGAALIALLAVMRGDSLAVPRKLWPRLILAAVLNVGCWTVLMGLALLWLPASETSMIAYTMAVWASLIAWPVLGERPTPLRIVALVMALAGIAVIMGGSGFSPTESKWPGFALALAGSVGFALGTVLMKKYPVALPPLVGTAWQIGLGCLPVTIAGLLIETSHFERLTPLAWWLLVYSAAGQCLAYVAYFAALTRLPASIAAIGTLAVPVIGVVTSAIALQEPLGVGQIVALSFTLVGVALSTRT
ncbi:MAG: DMT family transporter [Bradyrhizobium sp.]|uniref:DMT family transporter n=1 Tax=Bradyrhizobium sp. TaxID=376 RepID=UPI001D9D9CF6|nr:DMT family transporter [Bradyrhizobium sp.]MBV9562787.1 DMT family transporter [Bradyrhizobium sp.]